LKNNLTHPNEYVRGSTLRFLCKIKEVEILESLIPSVTANLVCDARSIAARRSACALTVLCCAVLWFGLVRAGAPPLVRAKVRGFGGVHHS
jgi:hypothetical protein